MNEKICKMVTDRIVGILEQGTVPWQKPWASAEQFPQNLISRKPYRGVNVFLLHAMSYASPFWLTYKQVEELGGHVLKGEKSCPVIFWKWLDSKDQDEQDQNGKDKRSKIPFLRYYNVFNVAQCDGISADKIPPLTGETRLHEPITEAEQIVQVMPKRPEIRKGADCACYSPTFDRVDIPSPDQFRSGQDFYSTLFHELTHSTGHASRLDRKGVSGSDGEWNALGSNPYAREELVAEMGASFLCCHCGIIDRTIDNSAAYIAGWLERLRNDVRLVVTAASQAQKAADFILSKNQPQERKQ